MPSRKIIIDTDPGTDDAVAILLALASPEVELLALTCVAGNVPLSHTATNARKILELAGRPDIPVFAGCDAPLGRQPLVTAEDVHGHDGLEGVSLPAPKMPLQERHAVDYLIDTLRTCEADEITLVPIGPLTNIATALQKAPEIAGKIREIVIMGGASRALGNITPTAEFNIYVDPDAADVVFRCGAPITLLSLDVTHQALVTPARVAAFRALGTPAGDAVAGLTDFPARYNPARYGDTGIPLHDPTTIAWLIAPELFSGKTINVAVETQSPLTLGMTVCDWWNKTDRPPNTLFLETIDAPGFFSLLTERIARL